MLKIKIAIIAVAGFFVGGCYLAATMGTPTRDEKKIPAEFNLSQHNAGKILVFVPKDNFDRSSSKLAYNLNKALIASLISKKIIGPNSVVIPYSKAAGVQQDNGSNETSAIDAARLLNADTVLYVRITSSKLAKLGGTGYYEGSLKVNAALINVSSGRYLWPEDGLGKDIKVGFDYETAGYEAALKRLSVAAAHCTTRYLYDCSLAKFKIFEESSDIDW